MKRNSHSMKGEGWFGMVMENKEKTAWDEHRSHEGEAPHLIVNYTISREPRNEHYYHLIDFVSRNTRRIH